MARTDALVLGAGIVGTSIALHLAKRGLSVALIDRAGAGRGDILRQCRDHRRQHDFSAGFSERPRVCWRESRSSVRRRRTIISASCRTSRPGWPRFMRWSRPQRLVETAMLMRPFFARAVAEHEALIAECGAGAYLRKTGWLKLFREDRSFAGTARERDLAASFGIPTTVMDLDAARALEPSLEPVFRHAIFLPDVVSVSNPLALTRAYAQRFDALGGVLLTGDARTLRRDGIAGASRPTVVIVEAAQAVVALGPWAPDLLAPLGIRLPLGIKRGYHQHFRPNGNAALGRPVLDADIGYCLAPMEQGIRITTGAEFAARDAPPTPVQFARLMPAARELFPLGDPVEPTPWMGSRPCFADSRPVIGRAPGPAGSVARVWPRPLGSDARRRNRSARRRALDRGDPVH